MKRTLTVFLCVMLLLTLTACKGKADKDNSEKLSDSGKVTEVDTITDFLDAIAPGETIKLNAGIYNLSDAKGYGGKNVSDYYHWENMGDEEQFALIIEDVENLSICGENAEIVTDSKWAYVLSFNHCDNLYLSDLKLGHSDGVEACEGGVINLSSSDNAVIEGCNLYGCGSVGVNAYQSWNLSISNTDIHNCSSGGINYGSGKHLKIESCSIYECGTTDALAWSCFNFSDTDDVHISSCSVKNNQFGNFVAGYFDGEDITLDSTDITDNTFDSVFEFDGKVKITGLNLNNNIINQWHDQYYNPVIILDGETYSEQKLNEIYGSQLSSKGVGTVITEPKEINTDGTTTVHVSTADEFINAIASDTLIIIDAEEIDLSTAKSYGTDAAEFWSYPESDISSEKTIIWQQVYDGYALWIGNVSNLHIQGGKITTQPRYANVLSFWSCVNISVNGTILGHSQGSECAGGVIYISGCSDIIIESCELYGCGIYGIETLNTSNLYFQNNYIHDCSYGAASFSNSDNITCSNTAVISVSSPALILDNCENFVWDNTLMASNCKFDPAFG